MKKAKKRKYIFIGTITIVLGILSFIVYQSYAYFKVNYTGNIINTVVGPFGSNEYAYTGTVQEFTVPANGYYEVELWGASGGTDNSNYQNIGRGGYTSGIILLQKNEVLYFYIGGTGYNDNVFNNIKSSVTDYTLGGSSVDVRLEKGVNWYDMDSLRSRIMVAGGGGGGEWRSSIGGNGGGLIGGIGYGTLSNGSPTDYTIIATGGSQTSGGTWSGQSSLYPSTGELGYFGYINLLDGDKGGGGGGGYYAGASRYTAHGGGGGSSYVSGYSGVNSVQETGGTATQPLHTNNTLHYSGKYFIKGSMVSGVNNGNGKAKITYVGTEIPERTNTNLDSVRYIRSCSSGNSVNINKQWVELQAIKNGINVAYGKTVTGSHDVTSGRPYSRLTDGDITADNYTQDNALGVYTCLTIDLEEEYDLDEISLWLYYGDGRRYDNNVLTVGPTNTEGATEHLSTIIHRYTGTTGYNETSQGKRYTAWD